MVRFCVCCGKKGFSQMCCASCLCVQVDDLIELSIRRHGNGEILFFTVLELFFVRIHDSNKWQVSIEDLRQD
jgi:hypothetical protein